jgi:suppressor for copper-sensitivity B
VRANTKNHRFLVVTLLAGVAAPPPAALESQWRGAPEGEVRLIAAHNGFDEAGRVLLGLEFRLQPGWKTYWRSAGDTGGPPIFDWQKSQNLADAKVLWPAPVRFSAFGYDSFGYSGSFALPIVVLRRRDDDGITVRLRLDYQICEKICLPTTAELALTIADGPISSTRHQVAITEAQARIPKAAEAAAFGLDGVSLSQTGGKDGKPSLRVSMRCRNGRLFRDPDLLVEGPAQFGFGRPRKTLTKDGCGLEMELPVFADGPLEELRGGALTLTLIDEDEAGEFVVFVK